MDESKFLLEILQRYGISGLIVFFLFWKYYLQPRQKKSSGTWVSYESFSKRLIKMEETLETHSKMEVDKFALLDLNKAVQMEKNIHFSEAFLRIEKGQDEMKENQRETFRIIGEIKNLIIQKLNGEK